jgi:tetratricopeptide (TPR) repeat protein
MPRIKLYSAIALLFITVLSGQQVVVAKDTWISVQSRNFFLVGNASEKEIRRVGVRLEQFRDVFTRLFPKVQFTTPVPTTVIVFKNNDSYKPFKPNPNIAGYFQPGPDVNYISLTTELEGTQNPFTVIFHEYTHLLVDNTLNNAPLWFNEGLAEYYSTFSISDDQKFVLGSPIANHVFLLRESKMLPLRTLFAVDHKSPHYNERDKQSIFYAQSWALMHYLIIGKAGRADQLATFVNQITANVPLEEAFQQAFQMTIESMEKELREYIRQSRYNILRGHFERKLETDKSLQTAPISEADAQAYLGDLLLHSNRKDFEVYLKKALALDPGSVMANAAMGMAKVREGKSDEALTFLERAVTANSQNYLAHYYYGVALSGVSSGQPISGLAPETASKIRQHLLKSIELRPDYPASYSLLGFVSLVTGNNLDEAKTLVSRALRVSPGRSELMYTLGQLYMRSGDYKQSRQLLEQVAKAATEDGRRQSAEAMLAQLRALEEYQERVKQRRSAGTQSSVGPTESNDIVITQTVDTSGSSDPSSYLRDVLRKPGDGEKQLQAILLRIDCDGKNIFFVLKAGERTLRLRTNSFEDMEITTYDPKVQGDITCGVRKPENSVLVCFIPQFDKRLKTDGVIKSIEFVPADFKLEPGR